jgi:hypothetical protein
LETVTLGANGNVNRNPINRRGLVCILTRVVATRREFLAIGIRELEGFAIGTSESINQRIEAKIACESKSCHDIGGSYEGMGCGIRVITAREVAIV